MQDTFAECDVLTIAVLLPQSDAQRAAFMDLVANNGDLAGSTTLNAVHGHLINYVHAMEAVADGQEVTQIYQRLQASQQATLQRAMLSRASEVQDCAQPTATQQQQRPQGSAKLGLLMFILGCLVTYNVMG